MIRTPHEHTRAARGARPSTRRGSIYLLVIIVSAILTTIGLTTIAVVARELQSSRLVGSVGKARMLAVSGVDLAGHRLTNTPDWRTLYASTPIVDAEAIGSGIVTVTWSALDAAPLSPVSVLAEATVGEATQLMSVTFQPRAVPFGTLSHAVHVAGDIVFSAAIVYADAPIAANSNIFAMSSEIDADVEAAGGVTGGSYLGLTSSGSGFGSIPAPVLFDDYAARAVPIPFASLPSGRIEDVVLSPGNQPFTGVTHPAGLYVIDCQGANITLRNCRIVGTLILLNVGASSRISEAVLMEPARPGEPTLLVQGSITIRLRQFLLSEPDLGTNFNPVGTPYEGVEDSTIDDRYPSEIRGLIYVSGTLSCRDRAVFDGVVLAGRLECSDTFIVRHDRAIQKAPPDGFVEQYHYTVQPGTWERAVK
ncbi:MAG: hypothetical protein IIB55_00640 [Planctomycetes bacterium]|nr:hypothetical protein [Planctomycetota bacterium]